MILRLRYIMAVGIVACIVAGAVWIYSDAGQQMATGEGGLPLIRASSDPVKLPPEDPGGEVMPHADSTVFAAISSSHQADPSMSNLKMPEEESSSSMPDTEFAGLRTGFAVPPPETEKKVESLFSADEQEAKASEEKTETATSGGSKYFSGLAPEAVEDPVQPPVTKTIVSRADEPKEEPKQEDKKSEPVQAVEPKAKPLKKEPEIVQAPDTESVSEPEVAAVLSTEGPSDAAQALEAQEKAAIRPTSKPQPPVVQKEEKKAEPKKAEEAKSETPAPKPDEEKKSGQAQLAPVHEIDVAPASGNMPAPRRVGMAPVIEAGAGPSSVSPAQSSLGGFVIQLASVPDQSEAERTWKNLQKKYPNLLQGLQPDYKSVDSAIRVRAGTFASRDAANDICGAIRAQNPSGGGCLVLRR